jgi:hypothetical protein
MIPDFDENGNLPPVGLIRPTIQEFEERFVKEADDRKIRQELFNGYNEYCNNLISLNVSSVQWVNGSFTTKKLNPNDIDVVIHFDGMKIRQNKTLHNHIEKLIDKNEMKLRYKCHPQFVLVYPKTLPDFYSYYIQRYEYWLKWFSRDRSGNNKGLIEFNIQNTNFKSDETHTGETNHAHGV